MQLLAAGLLQPGDVSCILQPLHHLPILFDRQDYRDGLSLLCDDLGLGEGQLS